MAQVVPVAAMQPGKGPKGKRLKLTGRVRAFLEAIRRDPRITLTEAAKIAGYGSPQMRGSSLARKWPQEVEEARKAGLRALKVTADEAEETVASLMRDPAQRGDIRLKASETFLKMHGKLSDKLTITLDRTQLNQRLDELLQQMAEQRAVDISAQQVSTSAKQLPEPVSDEPKA